MRQPDHCCRPTRGLVILVILVALGIGGCGGSGFSRDTQPIRAGTPRASLLQDCPVLSVSEVSGQTLVELPVGSDQRVYQGDFFHLFSDPDDDTEPVLKATVMVTELLGNERCLARQVGQLLDRQRPLATSDRAQFVHQLSSVGSLEDLHQDIATERMKAQRLEDDDLAAYDVLRETYQERLTALDQRHERRLSARAAEFEEELVELQTTLQRQAERREAAHQAELIALRAALADEARAAVTEQQQQHRKQLAQLRSENHQLLTQIEGLLTEQERSRERLVAIEAERSRMKQRHRQEMLAEVETRQVLEERISQLEASLAGRVHEQRTILSHDPERNETMLERVERLRAERDAARTEATDLGDRLQAISTEGQRLHKELTDARRTLATLEQAEPQRLQQQVTDLQAEVDQWQQRNRALELAQLRTERAYYDLASRLLRLPDQDRSVADLQVRLRQALAQSQQQAPVTETPTKPAPAPPPTGPTKTDPLERQSTDEKTTATPTPQHTDDIEELPTAEPQNDATDGAAEHD